MRIVSKKKDYYDGVQAMGQDRSLVYVREETIIDSVYPFPFIHDNERWEYPIRNISHVIGFCGKIYPLVRLELKIEASRPMFCYSIEDVDIFMTANLKKRNLENYFESRPRYYGTERNTYERFFEKFQEQNNYFSNLFQEHRCPIFVGTKMPYVFQPKDGYKSSNQIVFNPLLRLYEFFRIMDAYTAFQEISMFLGNMAMPEKPILELTNDEMIECKGFDRKTSFRKPPAKK